MGVASSGRRGDALTRPAYRSRGPPTISHSNSLHFCWANTSRGDLGATRQVMDFCFPSTSLLANLQSQRGENRRGRGRAAEPC